jgi:hypothetical protein
VSQDWESVLDALEAEVAGAERAESPEISAFVPPAHVGPMPPALADRAVALLRRMAERQAELERRRAEIGRELATLSALSSTAAGSGARPVPHFLDTTA